MRSLPPGPKGFIGLRLIPEFNRDALGILERLHREHGDLVYTRLGPYKAFFLFHPNQVRELLVLNAKHIIKMRRSREVMRQWDGNGLLLSEGEFWHRQHRLVLPAFHASRFAGYASIMVDRTRKMGDRWASTAEVEIEEQMTSLALEITAEALFGAEVSGETARLKEAVAVSSEVATKELGMPLRWPLWAPLPSVRRKRQAMEVLDSTIRRFIRQRRESRKDRGDLLSMLLLAGDSEGDGKGMSDEQARDEAMVLFLAGHDTTAAGLTWLWYELARNPEVAEKVFAELKDVVGNREPALKDVPRLPYLGRVVKEALRLYPPAVGVFAREATQTIQIGGYEVHKGELLYAFSWITHRDPRWFPEPETFDPDRFLPDREKTIVPFAYFPFGGGPRVCIGQNFALTEMILVTASLLRRYRVSLAAGQGSPQLLAHLSLRPKGGIRLKIASR